MNPDLNSEYGQIKIYHKVIIRTAELSAREVPGVNKVGAECYGFPGKVMKSIGFSFSKVIVKEGKEIEVSLPIIVDYEFNAVDVAYEVQRKIVSKLLQALNIDSMRVNVQIKKTEGGK